MPSLNLVAGASALVLACLVVAYFVGLRSGAAIERGHWNRDYKLPGDAFPTPSFIVKLQVFDDAFVPNRVPHRYLEATAHEKAGRASNNLGALVKFSGETWHVHIFLAAAPKASGRNRGYARGTLMFMSSASAIKAVPQLPDVFTLSSHGRAIATCRIVHPPRDQWVAVNPKNPKQPTKEVENG